MLAKITNPINAPLTIKVEQLVNGVYITLSEQQINSSKEIGLDFISQSTAPIRASFTQSGSGFTVNDISLVQAALESSTQIVFISNTSPDFGEGYRFGFNGQEKDDEIAGVGNHNTALFWEYDTRLGRRWNIDPVVKEWESGYACFYNNPTVVTDVYGDDGDLVPGNPTLPEINICAVKTPKQHSFATISPGGAIESVTNSINSLIYQTGNAINSNSGSVIGQPLVAQLGVVQGAVNNMSSILQMAVATSPITIAMDPNYASNYFTSIAENITCSTLKGRGNVVAGLTELYVDNVVQAFQSGDPTAIGLKIGNIFFDVASVAVGGEGAIGGAFSTEKFIQPKFLRGRGGNINGLTISKGPGYGAKPRFDIHRLNNKFPSRPTSTMTIPSWLDGKFVHHYHRGKGNNLHYHRPWEIGPDGKRRW